MTLAEKFQKAVASRTAAFVLVGVGIAGAVFGGAYVLSRPAAERSQAFSNMGPMVTLFTEAQAKKQPVPVVQQNVQPAVKAPAVK